MDNLIEGLATLKKYVYQAGQVIFQMTTEGFKTAYKTHKDPVTTADLKANSILREGLLKALTYQS